MLISFCDMLKPEYKLKKQGAQESLGHYGRGTEAPWYEPRKLSEMERVAFRLMARKSARAKRRALLDSDNGPARPINTPSLNPDVFMPQLERSGLKALSLFSGGGGLDFGFDRAGFDHVASYETVTSAAQTLSLNRPNWIVFGGEKGDVTTVDWKEYRGLIDVVHGGPPCQPFSSAGRQNGQRDERNLFPEFVRAVRTIKPRAFVAENVRALGLPKFRSFLQSQVLGPLSKEYQIYLFELRAPDFGVPQVRTRLFIVGVFRGLRTNYLAPKPTHHSHHLTSPFASNLLIEATPDPKLEPCMGARKALGLPDIGFDALAPTLRSGLTGPRHTTSILSSVSALRRWNELRIWPNGVAATREQASRYIPDNGDFRLAVADCAILQGFSESWQISGPVYVAIGQIGNSVAPPVAYHLARSISEALRSAF